MNIEATGIALRDTLVNGLANLKGCWAPHEIGESIPNTPWAVIFLNDTEYPENDSAHRMITMFRIQLFVARGDQPTALSKIMKYIETDGDDSIRAALLANYRLDSNVDWATVTKNSGQRSLSWGEQPYLGTEFEIKCVGRY